jgi:hypothetical protein
VEEHEVVWPIGMSDQDPSLADRPLLFNPRGFLVAILEDDNYAEQARAALQGAGFADRDLRVYTSQQILDDHERYLAQRGLARRMVGAVTVDQDAIKRYLDRAREGRAALWVHVPDDADAKRAVRCLADHRSSIFATTAGTGSKTSTSAEQANQQPPRPDDATSARRRRGGVERRTLRSAAMQHSPIVNASERTGDVTDASEASLA